MKFRFGHALAIAALVVALVVGLMSWHQHSENDAKRREVTQARDDAQEQLHTRMQERLQYVNGLGLQPPQRTDHGFLTAAPRNM